MLVAVIILGLIGLSIYGLARISNVRRTGGTSLRRTASSHINANGSPKRVYASMDAAREAARQQTAATQHEMSAYKCGTCLHFHIGHS